MKGKARDTERHLPPADSLLKQLQQPGLGQQKWGIRNSIRIYQPVFLNLTSTGEFRPAWSTLTEPKLPISTHNWAQRLPHWSEKAEKGRSTLISIITCFSGRKTGIPTSTTNRQAYAELHVYVMSFMSRTFCHKQTCTNTYTAASVSELSRDRTAFIKP